MATRPRKAQEPEQSAAGRPDGEPTPLQIHVDADVRIACAATPRAIIEALRRQLRRHDIERLLQASERQPGYRLLRTTDDEYRLPQTLLSPLLEICRRAGLPYRVVDQRTLVDCPRLHRTSAANGAQTAALRQLLLRDCGVLVAADPVDRITVAAEIVARRQQRTLVFAAERSLSRLRQALGEALALEPNDLQAIDSASNIDRARLVVAPYERAVKLDAETIQRRFGLMVFDGLSQVAPATLLQLLSVADAHYLLGLAADGARADGLQAPISYALGGVAHRMATTEQARATQLAFRRRPTTFHFDYRGREHYQSLLAHLAADTTRNQLIAGDLTAEIAAGHPCLVLSERRDHLDEIARQLPADQAQLSDAITSAVRPSERDAIMTRFARGKLMVLLVTGQIASDSLSLQRARRLFIAFPFSYGRKLERIIEQLMRPSAGKSEVVVYDYDDVQLAPLHRACEKRSKIVARLQRAADRAYADWAQMELKV